MTSHPPIIYCHQNHLHTDQGNEEDNKTDNIDQHPDNEQVKHIISHLKDGATIQQVFDNDVDRTVPYLITRSVLLKHRDATMSQHRVIKNRPGPLQSYYDSENNVVGTSESMSTETILTANSQLVFIKQLFQFIEEEENDGSVEIIENSEDEEETGVLKLNIFFLDFTEKVWKQTTHCVPVWGNFGTYTFTLHKSQLLLSFNRPLKIVAFDFNEILSLHQNNDEGNVIKYEWKSEANVTRMLSCLNFVLLFTNQNEFLSLTFNNLRVAESKIRKPCTSLKEEYDELVQIVNVRGKIVLIAQKDSKLLFFHIKSGIFVPIKTINLTGLRYFQSSFPLIIKNMMSWKQSRLFVPVAVMRKSFPEDDQVLSESASIVEVNLNDFNVVSICQVESKVDIYQEAFYLSLHRNGALLLARKERKSADHKGALVTSTHIVELLPSSLKSASLSAIVNGVECIHSKAKRTGSKHYARLILQNCDF